MTSIRTRLLIALLALVAASSLLSGTLTYRRVLAETSILFDYQLRQMALSLRSQVSMAPRLELPPAEADADFVIQIWDLYGARVYLSRPGLPLIDQTALGYADVRVGETVAHLRLADNRRRDSDRATRTGARGTRTRRGAARRDTAVLLIPVLGVAIVGVVGSGLLPLRRVAIEVQRRNVHSLTPIAAMGLPREIAPLVQELNRLLMRLHAAFQTQRAFIADAAHELRSPLTAVRLDLQLLDRAPDESARLEARTNLGAAVERAIRLVEQLLTLARNEPREERDELSTIQIEAAAADGIADTHTLALARQIDLGLEADPNTVVLGDREALRTLVRNLVDNAVRYTPTGGRVQVRIKNTVAGAVLEVTDSGPGIRRRIGSAPSTASIAAPATGKAAAGWDSPSSRRSPIDTTLESLSRMAPGGGLQVDSPLSASRS